jgi:hypothetical protein
MRPASPFRFITPWTVLGSIGVFVVLLAIWGLILLNIASAQPTQSEATAVVQVIPPPTSTSPSIATLPPTPTTKPEFTTPVANSQIKIGDYVQIANTGGDGLRIRSGAGTGNPPLFLGMESEVFKVTDGPKESDGYVWWNLVAPYDNTRAGWAASNFLAVVAQQP